MKNITINGFHLAIFKVGTALHITVLSVNTWQSVDHEEFKRSNHPSLFLYNEFATTFGKLPEEWKERMVKHNQDKEKQILIIIIK